MAPLLAEASLGAGLVIGVATESAFADTMEFTDKILTSTKKSKSKTDFAGEFFIEPFFSKTFFLGKDEHNS